MTFYAIITGKNITKNTTLGLNNLVANAHRLTPFGSTRAFGLLALFNAPVPPVCRESQPPAYGLTALTLPFVFVTRQVIFTVSRRVTHFALPILQPFDVASALDASDDNLATELVRHTGLEVPAQLAMAKGTCPTEITSEYQIAYLNLDA